MRYLNILLNIDWLLFCCFCSFIFNTFASNRIPFLCFWAVETFLAFFSIGTFLAFLAVFDFGVVSGSLAFGWITFGWMTFGCDGGKCFDPDAMSFSISPAFLSFLRFLGFTNSKSDNWTVGGSTNGFGFDLSLLSNRMLDRLFELHTLQVISYEKSNRKVIAVAQRS